MKYVTAIILSFTIAGCAQIKEWVPSFWDDNQAAAIINVRQLIHNIDCDEPQDYQSKEIKDKIQWFQLYSESKGSLQNDMLRLVDPIKKTADDWNKRASDEDKPPSVAYCKTKKKLLIIQIDKAAHAVLGRW